VQGSTSPDSPQSITVLNLGNLDLAISSAVFATSTPSTGTSFTNDSTTTCTSALVANSSCVYGIDFRPAAGGTNTGSLTLTDNTLGSVGSTQTITLTGTGQALVSKLAFGQAPAANVTAGGNAGSAITILEGDSSGATVTSQTDVITLIATGPNGYQQTYMATAVAGIATFNLSGAALNTSGVYTYTASAGSPTNAVATENVSAASASAVSLSGGSTSVTAGGNAGVISATIEDAHGNSVTSYSGAVTYTLKNAAGVIIASGSSTASSGIASLNLSGTALTLANTDTLTVTAASVGSTSETIAVSPGAASKTSTLTGINTSSTYTPGSVLGPLTTTVVDAYGNTVTSYSGTITYTLTLPNGTTTTGATITVTSTRVLPAGSYVITGTFTPTDSTTYKSVTATGSLRIAALAPAATIMASVNPVALKNTTVLSASVSSSVGVPTGTSRLYAESLFGAVHGFNSIFPSGTNGLANSADALSMFFGGGIDTTLHGGFGIRLIEAGFVHTNLPNNAADSQNDFRLGFGLSYRR
jgi:hypothetical protein